LAVVNVISLRSVNDRTRAEMRARQEMYELLSSLKDAETGQRGYLLAGADSYLEPYQQARAKIPLLLDELATDLQSSQSLESEIRELRRLSLAKLAELEETIRLRREEGLDAALQLVRTNKGQETMQDLRVLTASMLRSQSEAVQTRF